MTRRRDPHTLDLLAWEPTQVAIGYDEQVAGRGELENRIARIIARALRDARDEQDLDRDTVAKRMTTTARRTRTIPSSWCASVRAAAARRSTPM